MNVRVNQMQGRKFFLAHEPNFVILPFAFLLLPSNEESPLSHRTMDADGAFADKLSQRLLTFAEPLAERLARSRVH